jgi:hypothetical protein
MRGNSARGARAAAALSIAVLCGACGVPTAGVGFVFSQAIEVPTRVPHVLWLERVQIEQPVLPEQELLETAFTYNFARVLRQKKAFKAVKIETGAAAPDDWILRLRIERSVQEGKIPLLARILPPFTLGLYSAIGKIQELKFEMLGRFEVRDGSGRIVGSGEATHAAELDVYQKNLSNAFSFFLDERSRFLDELLDQITSATGERTS